MSVDVQYFHAALQMLYKVSYVHAATCFSFVCLCCNWSLVFCLVVFFLKGHGVTFIPAPQTEEECSNDQENNKETFQLFLQTVSLCILIGCNSIFQQHFNKQFQMASLSHNCKCAYHKSQASQSTSILYILQVRFSLKHCLRQVVCMTDSKKLKCLFKATACKL